MDWKADVLFRGIFPTHTTYVSHQETWKSKCACSRGLDFSPVKDEPQTWLTSYNGLVEMTKVHIPHRSHTQFDYLEYWLGSAEVHRVWTSRHEKFMGIHSSKVPDSPASTKTTIHTCVGHRLHGNDNTIWLWDALSSVYLEILKGHWESVYLQLVDFYSTCIIDPETVPE